MSVSALSEAQLRAAQLVAEGEVSNADIAAEIGITERTLFRWKNDLLFQAEIDRYLSEIRERILSQGVADRVLRVSRLNKRWNQIDRLIKARAEDLAHVPGGDTGLLCHTVKMIGSGKDAETVDEYKADVALMKEERELAKQAAIELGQWTEKLEMDFASMTDAELIARGQAALQRIGEARIKSNNAI